MHSFKNTLKLLRIPFSILLMPLFLFALSQEQHIRYPLAIISFFIIHLLVYPASNGYNSYIDKDTDSIGGLEHPPQPTKTLFYLTVLLDTLAVCLSAFFISYTFAWCILLYILASKAYSSRQLRLKKYPFTGFLIVVIFQGAFTFYMSGIGISGHAIPLNQSGLFILLACSLQIAGAYPLTQIYQHRQDAKDGVISLSARLGYKGTFLFTMSMFLLCNVFYYLYFNNIKNEGNFYMIQLFFLPIVIYFAYWFYLVLKDTKHADFKHTMVMNWIAAICMNTCFIVLFFMNHRL